jgi:hypothetical protein
VRADASSSNSPRCAYIHPLAGGPTNCVSAASRPAAPLIETHNQRARQVMVVITRTLHLHSSASRIARLARLRERIDDPPAILKRDASSVRITQVVEPRKRIRLPTGNAHRSLAHAAQPSSQCSCCCYCFSPCAYNACPQRELAGAQRACAACAYVLGCVLGGHDLGGDGLGGEHRRSSSVVRLIAAEARASARQRSIFELIREGEHGKLQLTACASFGGITSEG